MSYGNLNFDSESALLHDFSVSEKALFRFAKRAFDLVVSLLLLPLLAFFALALLILNPFFNRGSLFFVQQRMGQNCRSFPAIKFRSMRAAKTVDRTAEDPLEVDRITPLSGFLRKTRIDELPQIINVLRSEMSLIGPRPDYVDDAEHFLTSVP